MKQKLIDFPTRWGYYLIGIVAGFGVTAGLLQSPIGMFILLPALPLLCIILALVFTLRQRTADVLLPLLLLLGMAAAFQLWCVAEHESSWLTLLRAFFWPCLFSYFVTVYLVLHWSDGWCKKSCWLCYLLVAAVSFLLPWLTYVGEVHVLQPYLEDAGLYGGPSLLQLLIIPALCLLLGIWFPIRQGRVDLVIPLLVLFGYSISMAFHVRLLELFLGTQLDYCTLALILYLIPAIVFGLLKRKGKHIAGNPEPA